MYARESALKIPTGNIFCRYSSIVIGIILYELCFNHHKNNSIVYCSLHIVRTFQVIIVGKTL